MKPFYDFLLNKLRVGDSSSGDGEFADLFLLDCRISNNQSFADGTFTTAIWDTVNINKDNSYNATTGEWTAPRDMDIHISAALNLDTTGAKQISVFINGVMQNTIYAPGAGNEAVNGIFRVKAGDIVTIRGYTSSTVTNVDTDDYKWFQIAEITSGSTELVKPMSKTPGWDRLDTTSLGIITGTAGTRQIRLAPDGENPCYYYDKYHNKHYITTTLSTDSLPDVSGKYLIYIDDDGSLAYMDYDDVTMTTMASYPFVCIAIYYKGSLFFDFVPEQHDRDDNYTDHASTHFTVGTRYSYGLDLVFDVETSLTDYTKTNKGVIWDEDIKFNIPEVITLPFLYKLGASGDYYFDSPDNKFAHIEDGNSYASWNKYDSGIGEWVLQEGQSDSDYWWMYIIAIPYDSNYKMMKIIGQKSYASRSDAKDQIVEDLKAMQLDGLPNAEYIITQAYLVKRNGEIQKDVDGKYITNIFSHNFNNPVSGGSSETGDIEVIVDCTTADQTYNLNQIYKDGFRYRIGKKGKYALTITAYSGDDIADTTTTLESVNYTDSFVELSSNLTDKTWRILSNSGDWKYSSRDYLPQSIFGHCIYYDAVINFDNSMTTAEIQNLIDMCPKHADLDQKLYFKFADGTYTLSDRLTFTGFNQWIYILGNSSDNTLSDSKNVIIDGLNVNDNAIYITLCNIVYTQYLHIKTNYKCISYTRSNICTIYYCYLDNGTKNYESVKFEQIGSSGLSLSRFRQGKYGVKTINTLLSSYQNDSKTSEEPDYGLYASNASTIGKSSTQPTGAIQDELEGGGGQIR